MITATFLLGLALTAGIAMSHVGVKNTAGVPLPAVEQLPVVKELPDPFLFMNGTRVKSKKDWTSRRAELKALAQHYAYGILPTVGDAVRAEELESTTMLRLARRKRDCFSTWGRKARRRRICC